MKRLSAAAALIAILACPAYAQLGGGERKDPLVVQDEIEQRNRAEIEKRYNDVVRQTRTQAPAPSSDPWRGVRPAGETTGKR
jgi:hypothetical protein